jgi:Protein of unknown function (DUF1552)
MKRDGRYSRRAMLQAIGAGAALLPLLEADRADAQCLAGGIKRMYVLVWPRGMYSAVSNWATTGDDPTTWALAPFQSSLQPYVSKLLLLNGIDYSFIRDMPGSGERTGFACFPGMLTGAFYQTLSTATSADIAGGPSVDQYIGRALQGGGYGGLVSLNQGVFVKSTGRLSWKEAGQSVLPDTDPYHVFKTYFAGSLAGSPSPGDAGTAGAPPDNSKLIQKSILDYVMSDLNRFSGIVGTADKVRIQAHLSAVRDLEMRLGAASIPATGPGAIADSGPLDAACNPPDVGIMVDPTLTSNVPAITKLQMDLGVAAFASDLTRCIVLQIGDQSAANLIMTWLGFASGGPNPGDANTGDVNGLNAIANRNGADKVVCDTWFESQLAYIVGRLHGVIDVTGKSLLDSSVVVATATCVPAPTRRRVCPSSWRAAAGATSRRGEASRCPRGLRTTACWSRCATPWGRPSRPSESRCTAAS